MNSRDESSKQHRISIFIVDDHPMFREGLQQALMLEDDVNILGYAENGEDALRLKRGELALVLDGTRGRVVEVRRAPKSAAAE